jgi:hypothetical protein
MQLQRGDFRKVHFESEYSIGRIIKKEESVALNRAAITVHLANER